MKYIALLIALKCLVWLVFWSAEWLSRIAKRTPLSTLRAKLFPHD
jgi:hypothetical protein